MKNIVFIVGFVVWILRTAEPEKKGRTKRRLTRMIEAMEGGRFVLHNFLSSLFSIFTENIINTKRESK